MELILLKLETWIQAQQQRETRAPWTDTSVNDRWNLLLKQDKLGFQPSKQGRQELPGLIFQSLVVKTYNLSEIIWDSNPASKGDKSSLD